MLGETESRGLLSSVPPYVVAHPGNMAGMWSRIGRGLAGDRAVDVVGGERGELALGKAEAAGSAGATVNSGTAAMTASAGQRRLLRASATEDLGDMRCPFVVSDQPWPTDSSRVEAMTVRPLFNR
jgi:hypothetical protein